MNNSQDQLQEISTQELSQVQGGYRDFSDYIPTGDMSDYCGTGLPGGLGPVNQPTYDPFGPRLPF